MKLFNYLFLVINYKLIKGDLENERLKRVLEYKHYNSHFELLQMMLTFPIFKLLFFYFNADFADFLRTDLGFFFVIFIAKAK